MKQISYHYVTLYDKLKSLDITVTTAQLKKLSAQARKDLLEDITFQLMMSKNRKPLQHIVNHYITRPY